MTKETEPTAITLRELQDLNQVVVKPPYKQYVRLVMSCRWYNEIAVLLHFIFSGWNGCQVISLMYGYSVSRWSICRECIFVALYLNWNGLIYISVEIKQNGIYMARNIFDTDIQSTSHISNGLSSEHILP